MAAAAAAAGSGGRGNSFRIRSGMSSSPSSSPSKAGSGSPIASPRRRVEDNVPGFAQSMVRDFLRQRGFEGTLRAFDYELKNPPDAQIKMRKQAEVDAQPGADGRPIKIVPQPPAGAPSVRAWYEMSEQLGLQALMERNRKSVVSYPTLLEVLTREMVDTNLGKKGMGHLKLRRRRSLSSSEPSLPGVTGVASVGGSRDGLRGKKAGVFGGSASIAHPTMGRSSSSRSMMLSQMTEEDLARERAYDNKSKPEDWNKSMNEYQRQKVKEFQRAQAAKATLQLENRSVVELQQEMEKMLGTRQSPPRGRHHFKSPPIENEVHKIKGDKLGLGSSRKKNTRKGKSGKQGLHRKGSSGRLGDLGGSSILSNSAGKTGEEEDEDEISMNPVDAMRKYMFNRSKESWIPWNTRFKMLRKDIAVQKVNNMEQANFFDLLEKNEVSLDYLSLERSKEKFSGKGKSKCALCMQPYLKVCLPMQISFKAIMDLRRQWGLGKMGRGMGLKVPACYNKVAICLYCSQYFDEEQSYRMSQDATGTGPSAPDDEGLGANFLLGNGGAGRRGSSQGGGNRVTVEIFKAGDGKNYPKKGHHVIIHYSAYLSSGMLFGECLAVQRISSF